eukprot:gb/GFBE01059706.1/.p1 GENE.gb/GFBE01059706.1/~~gb/GFBE01059706.1/.p1  ORF type:complete len:192 (+),score=51.08 gb/GFBE01059706.1/:1-576(+)
MGNESSCQHQCETVRVEYVDAVLGYDHPDGDLRDTEAMNHHKLLTAARDGDEEMLKVWLEKGLDVDKRRPFFMKREREDVDREEGDGLRDYGLTPLMYAAQGGYTGCCRLLLEAKAAPNAEDEDGLRALHFAAAAGEIQACKLLLQFAADVNAKTDEGKTALDLVPQLELTTVQQRKLWQGILGPRDLAAC